MGCFVHLPFPSLFSFLPFFVFIFSCESHFSYLFLHHICLPSRFVHSPFSSLYSVLLFLCLLFLCLIFYSFAFFAVLFHTVLLSFSLSHFSVSSRIPFPFFTFHSHSVFLPLLFSQCPFLSSFSLSSFPQSSLSVPRLLYNSLILFFSLFFSPIAP